MTDQERDNLIVVLCKGFDAICERLRLTKWKPKGEAVAELVRLCELLEKPDCKSGHDKWVIRRIKDVAFDIQYDEKMETANDELAANQAEVDRLIAVMNAIAKIPEHQK